MTPLSTVPDLRLVFEVSGPDPYQDALINKYIAQASAAIYSYTQIADFGLVFHPFDSPRAYNTPVITVDQIPIIGATLTGTTTSGSPIVTDLPSTVGLFVNQCCASNCPNFPAGQVGGQSTPPPPPNQLYITAIGSNQVTLSQNANISGPVTMNFGVALWQNWNSYGGTAPGAFQNPNTLLQEGCDYFLDWDNGPGGVCSSGIIRSINNIFYAPQTFDLGYITPFRGASQSSLKLQYYSGGIGPNGIPGTVPWAVQAACEMLVAIMRRSGPFGKEQTSLSDGQLSATLGAAAKTGLLDPAVTTLLAPYKTIRVGA